MSDFLPTMYNEEDDITTTYRPGFPYVMRDQGLYGADELCAVVLDDIADVMSDRPELFRGVDIFNARALAARAHRDLDRVNQTGEWELVEWVSDATFYPPDGVNVDWDGEAGTVTVTLDAGWESMRYLVRCAECELVSESNWVSKARSDADWHNTMTGHDSEVVDTETDTVV